MWTTAWTWSVYWRCFALPPAPHVKRIKSPIWRYVTERAEWFGPFNFYRYQQNLVNLVSDSIKQYLTVFWLSPQNRCMITLHVYRIMPFLLSFFFFMKGLSMAWQYLTILPNKISNVTIWTSLKNLKSFWLLLFVADWIFIFHCSFMKIQPHN